jgi:hypothetical protein
MGSVDRADGRIRFPSAPSAPGLYRFVLLPLGDERSHYIGETANLMRRMANYRAPAPSQPTNQRMNQRLDNTLQAGGHVTLDGVTSAEVDGEEIDLASKAMRRLLENAALVLLARAGVMCENL